MIIDFNVRPPLPGFIDSGIYHVWNYPTGFFQRMSAGRCPLPSVHQEEAFMEEFHAAGIDLGVIIGHGLLSAGTGKRYNVVEEIASFMDKYPGKFKGISVIEAPAPDTVEQVHRAKAMGMSGVCVKPVHELHDASVNDARFMDTYHALEEEGLILVLTLDFLQGNRTAYNQPRHVEDIATACPRLKIVVSHACYPKLNEFMAMASRYRGRIYALPVYYFYFPWINTIQDQSLMYNHMLQDQVLYGSAYPARSLKQALEESLARPWLPEPREKFLWKNAASLLGLDSAKA